jgi:hypothetical protein
MRQYKTESGELITEMTWEEYLTKKQNKMIHEMKMYGCDCDGHNCDEFWQDPETGGIAYVDKESVRESALESEWHITDDGRTFCPACHSIDDNDKITLNDGTNHWNIP